MKLTKLFIIAIGITTFVSCNHSKQPNVLFIVADDLGYHDLSVTGSKFYETPNIDNIATEGIQFTQGYANCQVCSPSRASLMTGMYTARHGITDWIGAKTGTDWRSKNRFSKLLPAQYRHALKQEYTTIAEAFRNNGYKTFFAGKWHIGDTGSAPEDHGFDINIGGYHAGSPRGGYFSPYKNPKLSDGENGENLSMRLAKETSKFIKNNSKEPFFAMLSFYAVHGPIQTSEEKWAKYRDKAEQMGIAESGYEMEKYLPIRVKQDNPIYGGLVESMDDAVGEVIKQLESLGLAENTIVVFTADNGGVSSGDNYSTSNLPLRGGKGYQWEGGIREPFFIKAPGFTKIEKCAEPVIGSDLYPTLLDLCNIELTTKIDGKSLVPLMLGKSLDERPLFWHYPHYGNQGGSPSSIIRKGDWKLIHYYEENTQELYNLKQDPWEAHNLASLETLKKEELRKELFAFLEETGANLPIADPLYDATKEAEHLEQVRTKTKAKLEKSRLKVLSTDFDVNNDFWGSKTID